MHDEPTGILEDSLNSHRESLKPFARRATAHYSSYTHQISIITMAVAVNIRDQEFILPRDDGFAAFEEYLKSPPQPGKCLCHFFVLYIISAVNQFDMKS